MDTALTGKLKIILFQTSIWSFLTSSPTCDLAILALLIEINSKSNDDNKMWIRVTMIDEIDDDPS